jgi:SRSO17 transposase
MDRSTLQEDLAVLVSRLRPCFSRSAPYGNAWKYIEGLLKPVERKNGWQLAEACGDSTPDKVQFLLDRAVWDADLARDELIGYVKEHLADRGGVLVVDETGFLKKGNHSAGVQRQYSGTAGRIENCQVGVFLAYTTVQGSVLVDRALYLPHEWLNHPVRCQRGGIPEEAAFQTKPQLALGMIEHALKQGLPVSWVTGDAVYGNNSRLRNWLENAQVPYVLGVSSQETVTIGFEFWRAAKLRGNLPAEAWQRLSAGSGSQGERWYDWACIPTNHRLGSDWQRYLLVRRSIEKTQEVAFYRVFCKADTTLAEMVRVAGQRWSVEQCFQLAKGETGLDQYEVRKWKGWYRHITLSMLALAFLVVQRARKKKASNRRAYSPQRARNSKTISAPAL